MGALTAGSLAFREAYFHADKLSLGLVGAGSTFDAFERYEARLLRYAVNWAFWQGDAYRQIHTWSKAMKSSYGMYRHTRHIYNPANRIAEFFVCHVLGGMLDQKAGSGVEVKSALPIEFPDGRDEPEIRAGIAKLWQDSRWQSNKAIWTRFGTVMGDAPLLLWDDAANGCIRMKPIHPGTLKWVTSDANGSVTFFIRQEWRYDPKQLDATKDVNPNIDPRSTLIPKRYTHECQLTPEGVVNRTFMNGILYAWPENPNGKPEWVDPWPFCPLVMTRHIDVGCDWGVGEWHPTASKIREADDLASKLDDQVRKVVDSPWLFIGMSDPKAKGGAQTQTTINTPTKESPEDDRQQIPALYTTSPDAKAQALVNDMKIADVSLHIGTILEEIERDHPELRYDRLRVAADPSGRALREARKPAETKVQERRAEYDRSLAEAQTMGLVMGGMQGYPQYVPATPDDWTNRRFLHRIGDRPTFDVNTLDRIEEDQAEADLVTSWVGAGVPLEIALGRVGWDEVEIKAVSDQKAKAAADALAQATAMADNNPDTTVNSDATPTNPA